MDAGLTDRKRIILNEIISDYVLYGDPVGSTRIAGKSGLGLSSASIRNVMSDLESMGLLTHPHTSSGRIPTEKAYRYYVNELLRAMKAPQEDISYIENSFTGRFDINSALRESSKLLSSLCHQMSIVMRPSLSNIVFKRIEFIKMGKGRLLALLISKTGVVLNKVFDMEEEISSSDVEKINNYLNSILEGLTIEEVKSRIIGQMKEEKSLYDALLSKALKLGAAFVEEEREDDFYVDGAFNILGYPEFADAEKMKRLFNAFEEKSILIDMLDRTVKSKDLSVWIGSESGMEEMEGLSLVTSPYGTDERMLGCIGILGSTRMDYSRVIPIVKYTARKLSDIIRED